MEEEAQRRLESDGYNELKSKEKDPVWKLFIATFKDTMVIVLLVQKQLEFGVS
ncbi:cation-transporting P-type ATPase [Terribacillus sp. 179-K 1B1 HS]|uniref:cation-transporting P-type ATPase n=1 Tax=Terribacillus sp. 179-K 1B1 HS TaxID=3142388 RepID=UPI0039A2F602